MLLKQTNAILKRVAVKEGKKSQVSYGNLKEVFASLVNIQVECNLCNEPGPAELIASIAWNKLNKKKKKKK